MSVDRIPARDTDVESVEEPPAADRTPPPDTPGPTEGPSRADSRAGAAAANAGPGERKSDAAEEPEDQAEEAPSASAENTPDESDPEAAEEPVKANDTGEASEQEPDPAENADTVEPSPDENPPANDDPVAAPRGLGRGADADEATAARPRDTSARRLEPLTDREYAEHTDRVEWSLTAAVAGGEATDVKHTIDPERTVWQPDRAKLHRQIVDDLYSAADDVPNDGQAIIAGGLGGAGKSTTLEGHAGVDRSNYLTINPDDIKESLARRGMIPPVKGLAPMERSALVHEESSDIAAALAGRAYADRKNVIWDITMSSRSSAARRLQQLREAGYRNVEGIFVHIPVDKSVERARERHRRGLEDHRNGEGLGGRYVPAEVIRANADPTWGSVNRGVFEEMKPQFDSWKLYDNSVDGQGPVLLESSDGSEREDDE